MKEFRSLEDVDAAGLTGEVSSIVRGTLTDLMDAYAESGTPYVPEDDGYTVLIESGDTDDIIRGAIGGRTLRDALFEGVAYERGCFLAVLLFNNQFGLSIVVPDEPWLDPMTRARLAREL